MKRKLAALGESTTNIRILDRLSFIIYGLRRKRRELSRAASERASDVSERASDDIGKLWGETRKLRKATEKRRRRRRACFFDCLNFLVAGFAFC